jgi:hypothetical protein
MGFALKKYKNGPKKKSKFPLKITKIDPKL